MSYQDTYLWEGDPSSHQRYRVEVSVHRHISKVVSREDLFRLPPDELAQLGQRRVAIISHGGRNRPDLMRVDGQISQQGIGLVRQLDNFGDPVPEVGGKNFDSRFEESKQLHG